MVLYEERVLQRLDPSVVGDSDSWPEFALRNVNIVSQTNGHKPVSLLSAHPTARVTVEGILDGVDRDLRHLVKHSNYRTETIRIRDVATYSFSQWEDGSLGFWAAGKAGWYEIRTTIRAYDPIYKSMEEATGMFYYLADKFRNSRRPSTRESVSAREKYIWHLMREYVNSDHSIRRDGDDARDGFFEHRRFLIKSMLEGQEELNWEQSPILMFFKRTFPKDFEQVKELVDADDEVSPPSESNDIAHETSSAPNVGHMPHHDISTPQKQKLKRVGSEDSIGSEDLESAVRTQTRSVLRPRIGQSSKKYTRHLADSTFSTRNTDADSGAEESEEEMQGVDSPSRQIQLEAARSATSSAMFTERDKVNKQAMPLPTYYENIASGDVWTCPYDGCNQRVWNARAPASIKLMEDHFLHAHAEPMANLIMAEMRPYNKVGHLLSRVKGVASMNQHIQVDDAPLQSKPGVLRRF